MSPFEAPWLSFMSPVGDFLLGAVLPPLSPVGIRFRLSVRSVSVVHSVVLFFLSSFWFFFVYLVLAPRLCLFIGVSSPLAPLAIDIAGLLLVPLVFSCPSCVQVLAVIG